VVFIPNPLPEALPYTAELGFLPFELGWPDDPGSGNIFPIIATNGLLYRPRIAFTNAVLACHTRLFTPRPIANVGYEGWNLANVTKLIDAVGLPATVTPYTVAEIKAGLSGRPLARFVRGWNAYSRGELQRTAKTASLKHNETLPYKKGGLRPRVIIAVDPRSVAAVQPFVKGASRYLRETLSGHSFEFRGQSFTVFFAYGQSAEGLSALYARSRATSGWVLWIAGDDSLIFTPEGRMYEGDFGGFDSTQGLEAHEAQFLFYQAIGAPDWVIDILRTELVKPVRIFWRPTRACPTPGYVAGGHGKRVTGGADTTVGNSTVHFLSVVLAISECEEATASSISTVLGERYGLDFVLEEVDHPTFLRGWFIDGTWLPLPSMVLKLGKSMTNPSNIVSKADALDAPRTYALVAKALALSPGPVPDSYPILGSFIRALLRSGEGLDGIPSVRTEAYRPTMNELAVVSRTRALEMVELRYGITAQAVAEVEALFDEVDALPAFVNHPALARLAEVDYSHHA
jgi:hypothetical protein